MIKYCRQILYAPSYVSQQMLSDTIQNSYPHVQKTYIMCGVNTWTYKENMIQEYDMEFIEAIKSQYPEVEFIFDNWVTEEDQRNAAVKKAKEDGYDWMFIQDADEFLNDTQYSYIYEYLQYNSHVLVFQHCWITFWKSWENVIVNSSMNLERGYPEFIINLRHDVLFERKRKLNVPATEHEIFKSGIPIFHGSYVLTDKELQTKLSCWGHATDFDTKKWYNEIWLNPKAIKLHPINPNIWHTYNHISTYYHRNQIPKVLHKYIRGLS